MACRPDAAFDVPAPGQFVHVDTGPERALRRPFSIAGVGASGEVELLIELRGAGTRALQELPVGVSITMLGPLGHGFTLPEGGRAAVVVAGGIGVAGVRYLTHRLVDAGTPLTVLVGARTAELLLHDTLPRVGEDRMRVVLATDDGSTGIHGTVCELLESEVSTLAPDTVVYCCGPRPMLDGAAAVALANSFDCELSLEEMMACGVGACRGCVVATVDGYRTVCKDGPVFDASVLLKTTDRLMEVARG
ncbi:dihydroorotate dehydrogenase electron transfer subunit [bacterium]|nr:dihydroorotate dehydrogenase electron transfer subunit [bacterium]